jgi:hypothetical protein
MFCSWWSVLVFFGLVGMGLTEEVSAERFDLKVQHLMLPFETDPYTASPDGESFCLSHRNALDALLLAGVAVLNTNVCTAMSLLTWTVWDVVFYRKPSVIGAVNGMITGLVAITPAAGFVAGWGTSSGSLQYFN